MEYIINDFRINDRVELHPATDLWMRGARYGTVERVSRKYLVVRLDALSRAVRVLPCNIGNIL